MPSKKTNTQAKTQLRIIGGKWRGRKLAIADVDGLRPTGDRIRETLFNWLQPEINGATCLDLFAGSGALGLESLSRGAQSITLVEQNAKAAALLTNHCQLLTIDSSQCEVVQEDANAWLAKTNIEPASIDIAFIDPPFAANLWQTIIETLDQKKCLAEGAFIYLESPKNAVITTPPHWRPHREKTAGDVTYRLFIAQALT